VETNHEILEHLERCPGCRAELDARERLRAAVKRSGTDTPGPASEFEARVKELLGATPLPRSLPLAPVVLLAASVAGIAALTLFLKPGLLHPGPETTASAGRVVDESAFDLAARNHLECAQKGAWPATAPLEAVSAKLDPDLAPVFKAVAPRLTGYRAVAAHLCEHGGREFFHVVFRKDGTSGPEGLVSLAANRKSAGGLPPLRVLYESHFEMAGRPATAVLRGGRQRGLDVTGAETADWMIFLVSSRGPEENLELARAVLPTAVTAFAGA